MGKNLEVLSEQENVILESIKQAGSSIEEHAFHLMIKIASHCSKDKTYDDFKLASWSAMFGEKYRTGFGSIYYSQKLHEDINSLIKKGYVIRNSEQPLTIFENKQISLNL